jgi:hypothetical protein
MFAFETPFLDLEIYRLVSILAVSPALAEFEGSESDKRRLEFLRNWERPEVSRIVVSLAAIIRSSLDAHSVGGGFYTGTLEGEALARQVSTLFPDEGNPHLKEPLCFREACNKVLHADRVDFETKAVPSAAPAPLTGRLILYGRRSKKEWRAELDLKEYASSALALTP